MLWRSSNPRRSFAGTVLGSEPIGVGGQDLVGEDRRCRSRFANLAGKPLSEQDQRFAFSSNTPGNPERAQNKPADCKTSFAVQSSQRVAAGSKNRLTPIETYYRGYRFRSRLEARWAVCFTTLDVPWQYEPEGFKLSDGRWYLPDFRVELVRGPCWREVVSNPRWTQRLGGAMKFAGARGA